MFLLGALFAARACGNTVMAKSCYVSDVQRAINSAHEGDTVLIPAGTCHWKSEVTVSGKGINIEGAASSRIIAFSSDMLAIKTGALTVNVATADPGVSEIPVTTGETLNVLELGNEQNFMTGTVTSYASRTLTMDITSIGGACGNSLDPTQSPSNCKRWIVATNPASVTNIINDVNMNGGLFNITEDSSFHSSLSNFQVSPGTYNAHIISLAYTRGGQAVLIHDCRITENPRAGEPPDRTANMIESNTNRGVIWNCSFESSPFNISTLGAVEIKDPNGTHIGSSWTTPSNFGMNDTAGQGNLYVEDCGFFAMDTATATDDNGRMVTRDNLYDNSGHGTHGTDSSPYGQRYFEFYNNVVVHNGYSDGSTFGVPWYFFLRGGTFVIHDNYFSTWTGSDYPNKPDVDMTVMNLQRRSGPDPCWGAGTRNGADYPAPRQIGLGYLTGHGKAPLSGGKSHDAITYVGDSEPAYIWNNNRALRVTIGNYGGKECSQPDSSANYIKINRDYYIGTPKPGYIPYTYPHPLRRLAALQHPAPAPPTKLKGVVH